MCYYTSGGTLDYLHLMPVESQSHHCNKVLNLRWLFSTLGKIKAVSCLLLIILIKSCWRWWCWMTSCGWLICTLRHRLHLYCILIQCLDDLVLAQFFWPFSFVTVHNVWHCVSNCNGHPEPHNYIFTMFYSHYFPTLHYPFLHLPSCLYLVTDTWRG